MSYKQFFLLYRKEAIVPNLLNLFNFYYAVRRPHIEGEELILPINSWEEAHGSVQTVEMFLAVETVCIMRSLHSEMERAMEAYHNIR